MRTLQYIVAAFCIADWNVLPATSQDPTGPAQRLNLYGDPLAPGAIAMLGTTRFRDGTDWNKQIALTNDGSVLVVANEEQAIVFFDVATGRRLREFSVAPMAIKGFALSPNGRQIAVGLLEHVTVDGKIEVRGKLQIIEAETGAVSQILPREWLDLGELQFTNDGKYLISVGSRGVIRVEEVDTWTELARETVPADSPQMVVAPDGGAVAVCTGPNSQQFLVWNWRDGAALRELKPVNLSRSYGRLAFSADGERLACGFDLAEDDIQIWDVKSGEVVHRLNLTNAEERVGRDILYTPDGETLVATIKRGRSPIAVAIAMWDAKAGEYRGEIPFENGSSLAMSVDGKTLAATSGAGMAVWRWPSRERIAFVKDAHVEAINSIAATSRGDIVTASDDGTVRVWDSKSSRQKMLMRHENWVRAMAISPDGSQVASSSLDDTVRLWDLATGREIYQWPGHGHLGGHRAVAFSPDGARVYSYGDDQCLNVWDIRTGKAVLASEAAGAEVDPLRGLGGSDKVTFSPSGSLLVASGGTHDVIETSSGKTRWALDKPGTRSTSVAVSADDHFLLASAWGHRGDPGPNEPTAPVTLWNLETGETIRTLPFPKSSRAVVAFSPTGKQFAVAVAKPKKAMVVYDTETGAEIQMFDDIGSTARSLCFGHDGKTLISGMADSTAVVWELK